MNLPKPDSFVMMVALLSEKLSQKEAECLELMAHIAADHQKMDDMQFTITDLRTSCEDLRATVDRQYEANNRQSRTISDLNYKLETNTYYQNRCAQLEQELLTLKYGGETDPFKRATTYMQKEGGKLWEGGNKIGCIKEVRACTGWGLKDAKDWCESNGPSFAPKLLEEQNGPKTKPSQDLVRKVG